MEQYYLNQPNECIKLPEKDEKYFVKNNLLGEIFTENDKALARFNLGITPLLEELKALYQSTPISTGSVRFGIEPTRGAYDEVLSSGIIYSVLQNYYTKEQFENWLLTLDDLLERKADKEQSYTKDEVETIINELNQQIDEKVERIAELEENLSNAVNKMEIFIKKDSKINIQFVNHSDSGTGLKVNITSESVLNSIKIYVNSGLIVSSEELCYTTQIPITITGDSHIKVVTTNVFGKETIFEEDVANDYFVPEDSIYIGGASNYQALFETDSPKEFTNRYLIELSNNSNIILLIPLTQTFSRADMNGIEIPFNEPEIINNFKVYTSLNTYQAGIYTIDINS